MGKWRDVARGLKKSVHFRGILLLEDLGVRRCLYGRRPYCVVAYIVDPDPAALRRRKMALESRGRVRFVGNGERGRFINARVHRSTVGAREQDRNRRIVHGRVFGGRRCRNTEKCEWGGAGGLHCKPHWEQALRGEALTEFLYPKSLWGLSISLPIWVHSGHLMDDTFEVTF